MIWYDMVNIYKDYIDISMTLFDSDNRWRQATDEKLVHPPRGEGAEAAHKWSCRPPACFVE